MKIFKNIGSFLEENLNGILGTIIFHLLVILIILGLKIRTLKQKEKVEMIIDFDQQEQVIKPEQKKKEPILTQSVDDLSPEARTNIAVNTANKLRDQISTEKYIQEVKQEYNIKDYTPRSVSDNDFAAPVPTQQTNNRKKSDKVKESSLPTNITFDLDNPKRWDKYLPVPVYKCEGSGQVVLSISVNQMGHVTSATVQTAKFTGDDECFIEAAKEAARNTIFNQDFNAPSKQDGTITYRFIAQ